MRQAISSRHVSGVSLKEILTQGGTTMERITRFLATAALLLGLVSSGSTLAQSSQSPATIFRKARPSIVLIVGGDGSGKPTVQGSGFIIGPDRIVTNHHVVAGTSTALAIFSDGESSPVTSVVADSATKDLIILAAATGQRPAVVLGDELALQQGDTVYAIGAPEGLDLTLTNGIVSAFRNIDGQFLIQSTAAIAHGSSGGPLFNSEGKVVGITSALLSDTPGIYFSVGAGDVKRLLRSAQLLVLPFTEWAKQNTGRSVPAVAEQESDSKEVGELDSALKANTPEGNAMVAERCLAMTPDGGVGLMRATAWRMAKAYPEAWSQISTELINSTLKAEGIGTDLQGLVGAIAEMRAAVQADDGEAFGKAAGKLLRVPKAEEKPDGKGKSK
jgi:S1-C subfamily serine protease